MTLPVEPPLKPMLSAPADDIPEGEGWLYEPKWDGFRGIVFREGDRVHIESRKGQPLQRYFPELCAALAQALPDRAVVDGEIIIAGPDGLDFEALQLRLHPAASRVNKLAGETPSSYVAFDLLAAGDESLMETPFSERRRRLAAAFDPTDDVFLTPQTAEPAEARAWFERFEGAGLDGVVAKRGELPYRPGQRVMVKVKHLRTADCVVGGFRDHKSGSGIGSLLLGMYDGSGVLHFVGHTSSFSAAQRREVREMLRPLEGGGSFGQGRLPGGPSRWSGAKDMSWTAVDPSLVCEVSFDHLQGNRFRHASRFLRWRSDKAPEQCTFEQLDPPHPFDLSEIVRMGRP
jgi:ATP-dependent DNA ligase